MTPNHHTTSAPTHKLVVSREFNASRERVWRAWTDPGQTKEWLGFGDGISVESVRMDLRAGGKFRVQTRKPDGEYFTAAGTYLEVDTLDRLVYTWDWEKDGGGSEFGEIEGYNTQLTVEFHKTGNGTRLVLTHERFESAERRDRHVGGWQIWIGKLANFVGGAGEVSTRQNGAKRII